MDDTQTSAPAPEQTSAPEVAETQPAEVQAAPLAPDTSNLPPPEERQNRRDEIYSKLEDFIEHAQQDERLKQDELLNSQGGHTGIDYNQVIADLPDAAKQLLSNMRSDYTRKTQDIAQQRRALKAEQDAWQSQRKAIIENEGFHEELAAKAEGAVEFNPFDENSYSARIEKEVAQRMQEMMEPLRKQHALQQHQNALSNFKSQHPDLQNYKQEIYVALKNNESLSLQDAYWMVKGKTLAQQNTQQQIELDRYRNLARQNGLRVGGANRGRQNGIPDHIKEQGSWAIAQYFMNNKGR